MHLGSADEEQERAPWSGQRDAGADTAVGLPVLDSGQVVAVSPRSTPGHHCLPVPEPG
jgi:hypothetical protein